MDFTNFLHKIGLSHLVALTGTLDLNKFVDEALHLQQKLNGDEVGKLYKYNVPKLAPDGSCSIGEELEDKPYDVSQIYEINSKNSVWLWRLNALVSILHAKTAVDWLGIYKKVRKENGNEVLLKLAYCGAPSRAEFPLTKEFASRSNNSTAGLTGRAILIQDLAQYTGSYYKCDSRVKSEFCCPIGDKRGSVLGIIDAESFTQNFFTPQKIVHIGKVCMDLGLTSRLNS